MCGGNDHGPEGEMPLGVLFKFIHLSAETRFNQNLQALNLTSSQMHILIYLDSCEREGKKVNQRDIEKHLHLSNPTVTGLLQRMEAKGFITRTVSEADGRNKEIAQTEKSRAIHAEMHRRLDAENAQMVRGLSAEEVSRLKGYLNRILDNIRDEPPAKMGAARRCPGK